MNGSLNWFSWDLFRNISTSELNSLKICSLFNSHHSNINEAALDEFINFALISENHSFSGNLMEVKEENGKSGLRNE